MPEITPMDILIKAKEIITKPEAWTKYASARTSTGSLCFVASSDAVSFCASGAVDKAALVLDATPLANRNANYMLYWSSVKGAIGTNDAENTNHADILAWFDRAIGRAEEI